MAWRHVLLYDGLCGLCSRYVLRVVRRDRAGRFAFAALQGPVAQEILARHGQAQRSPHTVFVVQEHGTDEERLLARAQAILFVLRETDAPRLLTAALGAVPVPLLDLGYRLLARLRYPLSGRRTSCAPPPREHRERFLDA